LGVSYRSTIESVINLVLSVPTSSTGHNGTS
jgi:hypothetical protein